jgi:MoaA/NifB/PqqE/SkfB family radical SAM enzyme
MKALMKKIIIRYLPKNISAEIFALYRLIYFRARKEISAIEFHLAEHCNLNCAGCDHFSSLAEEEYADVTVVEKDMTRLSALTNGYIKKICLIGGEPLLNKNITEIFYITRKNFMFPVSKDANDRGTRIVLFTNGILLSKQPDKFWQSCKDNKIDILITRYPIKIDTETITKMCSEYGINLSNPPGIRDDEMYRCVVSLDGKGDVKSNWKYCMHNYWTFLRNGRIYPCPFYANIHHFNRRFNLNLPVTDKDFIDIHKVKDMTEILRFLSKPIPACRYCDIGAYTYGHAWGISKKEISEWT